MTETVAQPIRDAKAAYKRRWPKHQRSHIKISFSPFPVKRSTFAWASQLLLRHKRAYRNFDHLVTIRLAGLAYRTLQTRAPPPPSSSASPPSASKPQGAYIRESGSSR